MQIEFWISESGFVVLRINFTIFNFPEVKSLKKGSLKPED